MLRNFLWPLIIACPPLFWGLFFIINVRKCWKYVHSCISSLRSLINFLLLKTESSKAGVGNWILNSLVAAALAHTWHVSAWGDHTCQGVTCIILTGELIGPISSCLDPAATCRGLECDISTTYYWDVLHFIITYHNHITVAIIIRIYFHDLHKINKILYFELEVKFVNFAYYPICIMETMLLHWFTMPLLPTEPVACWFMVF